MSSICLINLDSDTLGLSLRPLVSMLVPSIIFGSRLSLGTTGMALS